jgi:hypothetical protein
VLACLSELDPTLDLEDEERPYASVSGVALAHSSDLRSALADTIALLGARPDALREAGPGAGEHTSAALVRELLNGRDWKAWASLNTELPLLAEGSPEAFLDAIEAGLRSKSVPFDELYRRESAGLFGRTYMSGVLWALETLAWSNDHFGRAILALGRLAGRDPGGSWSNRASNSLTSIFLPWLPQTVVPFERRLAALHALFRNDRDVWWQLLMSLLPRQTQVSHGSRRPRWRDWIPDDWRPGVTRAEYAAQVQTVSDLLVDAVAADPSGATLVVEHLDVLSDSARRRLFESLPRIVAALDTPAATQVWRSADQQARRHRLFADAEWAMPAEVVDELTRIAEEIAPADPAALLARLFTDRGIDLFDRKGDYQAQHEELEHRRDEAVGTVLAGGGYAAVRDFALSVDTPWRVGLGLGNISAEHDSAALPDCLTSDRGGEREFARGYVAGRFSRGGWAWVDSLPVSDWSPEAVAKLLIVLPFGPEGWDRAEQLLPDVDEYWRTTPANPYGQTSDVTPAIDRLIDVGRPFAALRCVHYRFAVENVLLIESALRALEAGIVSTETRDQMSQFEVLEVIKALQQDPDVNADRLSIIEWAYLPVLDEHSGVRPIVLERRLANDPEFYAEIIRLAFKSSNEEEAPKRSPELAANGYRLLTQWALPPGSKSDGSFDGGQLATWLAKVAEVTAAAGQLEIAMTMAGHVLIHVPEDPSGLFIDASAAEALDAFDAEDLRDGYRTSEFNSRGVHFVDPTGAPERELAAKYRARADALEAHGFHRFAATVRDLQRGYELEAETVQRRAND